MLPSSNDLYYFQEVAQTLNVSRAAERLGVTQPSITMSLKRLEHNVGEQLFIRSKKGMTLTEAGKKLRVESAKLFDTWENIRSEIKDSEKNVKGHIKFGVHSAVAMYTLGPALKDLLGQYKELEVSLKHDLSRKILEETISHNLDISLVINPVKHPDLMMTHLCDDEVFGWKVSGANEDVIICDPSLMQSQSIVKKIKTGKYRFIHSNDLQVITKMALEGVGIGIIPERVCRGIDTTKLLKKDKSIGSFKDKLYLIYRVEYKGRKAIKEIASKLKELIK